ncbi:MAG: inositol monophosphatase [Deltaproteobacteria bacterium]|nr:inositol monophosphatase [Deltaproteobacteria bacterium]
MSTPPAPLDERLRVAIELARAAGRQLSSRFESVLTIETKSSDADLVTEADREAEAVILDGLRRAFPDDAILSEESGEVVAAAGPRWTIDPLDGTTNFAHRFPHFSVSIGLFDDEVGLLGVVHDPCRDETFFARQGAGAFLQAGAAPPRRLEVTQTKVLGKSLLATGFGYDRPRGANVEEFSRLVRRTRGIRRAGSAALDLAYVAAGRVDGFWELGLQPWDWAAGVVLVREAGGVVTAMDGAPWALRGPSVCACGPALHGPLRAALVEG